MSFAGRSSESPSFSGGLPAAHAVDASPAGDRWSSGLPSDRRRPTDLAAPDKMIQFTVNPPADAVNRMDARRGESSRSDRTRRSGEVCAEPDSNGVARVLSQASLKRPPLESWTPIRPARSPETSRATFAQQPAAAPRSPPSRTFHALREVSQSFAKFRAGRTSKYARARSSPAEKFARAFSGKLRAQ